jgi:hypothetical protein
VPATKTIHKGNCPYCTATWTTANAQNVVYNHIVKNHADKLEEFKKLNIDDYIELVPSPSALAEAAKEEELRLQKEAAEKKAQEEKEKLEKEEITMEQQKTENEQHVITPVTQSPKAVAGEIKKFELPFESIMKEEDWLIGFLQRYDLLPKFITFQIEKYRVRGILPHPRELLSDLNELESGSKLKKQNDLIVWFYDHALSKYMKQMESLNMPFNSLPPGYQPDLANQPTDYTIQRQYGEKQTYAQEYSRNPPPYSQDQSEFRELKEQLKQMQQEKQNELITRVRELEAKLEMQKQVVEQQRQAIPIQDPVLAEIRQRMEVAERKAEQLQQQLNEKSTQTILTELNEMKQRTNQLPTIETIQKVAADVYEANRTRLTPEDLERKIEEAVAKTKTGITPEAVEMKKIDNEFELEKVKIEADKSKLGNYGDIFQSAAGLFGEALGRGLSMGGQQPSVQQQKIPPQQQQSQQSQYQQTVTPPGEENVKVCPACNRLLQINFSPGVTTGQCPYCDVAIELMPSGVLDFYSLADEKKSPQPTVPAKQPMKQPDTQPVQQDRQKNLVVDSKSPVEQTEPALGACAGCGRDLYFYNIAETDVDGKQWCKTCSQNRST